MKKLILLTIAEVIVLCLLFNRAFCQRATARATSTIGLSAAGVNASTPGAMFHWRKVYGGYCVIQHPDSARTAVNNLQAGVYMFELKVTFVSGNIARDTVQVTVKRKH